ncbi:hypothetical protein DPF_0865 [Desulfoplanes formicivorans]|uniref:histidine kinase n=2 Tax=Desulfoplanes formicivorans TaxID=1592317 RepID=A0A194ADK4_9BACT|nr:hypothetical protein DPF_0865 [Desulfoplanes formicivorans]
MIRTDWVSLIVLGSCLCLSSTALAKNPHPLKRKVSILYISNFSSQYYWNNIIKKQIMKHFDSLEIPLDFYEEVLDVRRKDPRSRDAIFSILKKLYKEKYRNIKIDLIISSDDSIVGSLGRKLFPDVPFLFCYARNDLKKNLIDMGNASATIDHRNPETIIDIGIKLHPNIKHICIVSDYSEVSIFFSNQIQNIEKFYPQRKFVYIRTDNINELVDKLRQLDNNTFIIDTSYYSSPFEEFSHRKTKSIVFETTQLPVYSLWSNPVGNGVVAGMDLDPFKHGSTAARLAVQIIQQGSADNVPPVFVPEERVYFDYEMLTLFSIPEDILPPTAVVINKPLSFFEKYRATLALIFVVVVFFSIIITMLIVALRQKKREKKVLTMEIDVKNKEAEAREKLQQAKKMEALGTFSLGIAHDLNGVLGSISTCSRLAQQEISSESRAYEDLHQIDISIQRAIDLIRKISKKGNIYTKAPLPLKKAMDESMHVLNSQIPKTVEFNYENNIGDAKVLLDPGEIHQIVQNLCVNAVQAMDGHGRLSVCVHEDCKLKEIVISVTDTGKGIPGDHVERIFDPYFTTKKDKGGKGLGLFIVHNIIDSISGKITVKNSMNAGTCFQLYIPIAE